MQNSVGYCRVVWSIAQFGYGAGMAEHVGMDGSVTAFVTDPAHSTRAASALSPLLSHCTVRYREGREEPASSHDAGLFTSDRSIIGWSDHVVSRRYRRRFTVIRTFPCARPRGRAGARFWEDVLPELRNRLVDVFRL